MMGRFDFESLADEFSAEINSGLSDVSSVSRCDEIVINKECVLFLEFTRLSQKKLYLPNRFSEEVIENVKKIWGSFATFVWYLNEGERRELKGKRRVFVLVFREEIDGRNSRIVANLLKAMRKFRNGAFSEIKFKERP
jgi:hypothetical protein